MGFSIQLGLILLSGCCTGGVVALALVYRFLQGIPHRVASKASRLAHDKLDLTHRFPLRVQVKDLKSKWSQLREPIINALRLHRVWLANRSISFLGNQLVTEIVGWCRQRNQDTIGLESLIQLAIEKALDKWLTPGYILVVVLAGLVVAYQGVLLGWVWLLS